jgi:hypothetical protein
LYKFDYITVFIAAKAVEGIGVRVNFHAWFVIGVEGAV